MTSESSKAEGMKEAPASYRGLPALPDQEAGGRDGERQLQSVAKKEHAL